MHILGNLNSGEFNSQRSEKIGTDSSGIANDYLWNRFYYSADDFIALIDNECHYTRVNNLAEKKLSLLQGSSSGCLCQKGSSGECEHQSECPVWQALTTGKEQSGVVNNTKLGDIFVRALPQYNAEGKVSGVLIIANTVPLAGGVSGLISQKMQMLIDSMPEAILICNNSGTILAASNKFRELFHFPPDNSPEGSNLLTYLMPGYIETSLSGFLSVSNGTNPFAKGKYKMRRSGSDGFWAEVSFSPLNTAGTKNSDILVEIRDISASLQAEESLNKNFIRLSKLQQTFTNFKPDPASNIQQLIALYGEMLGASVCTYCRFDENNVSQALAWNSPLVIGKLPESWLDDIVGYYRQERGKFIMINKPFTFGNKEFGRFIDDNGITVMTIQTVTGNNRPLGLIVAFFTYNFQSNSEDIEFCNIAASATAVEELRITSQKAREESERNYRELFDFITDAIYVLNPEGVFIDVNSGATRLYGYSREELIGATPEMLSAEGRNDLEMNRRCIEKAFNGESQNFVWWGKRKNGEVFAKDVVLNRGRYFGKDVVIALGRDITERRQAEDKLQEYNNELKATNASKDKFFSILAHDLKNPFQGLLGFIDLLVEDIDELEKQQVKEYLQNIRSASYQTYSLLENLLEWSRIQTGRTPFQPTVFEVAGEIDEVFTLLGSNAMRKGIKLVSNVTPGIMVEADRNMAHSIIQNLVSNAIKFSNSYGKVTVEANASDSPKPGMEKTPGRKWLTISVMDNGVGITEDVLPQLFKLDGQVSMPGTASEPGTGLGLILCKEMVEKNGGKIWVTSEPGKGSTFSFTLPMQD